MAKMKKSAARITLRTVLEHVQALDMRMDKRFDAVDARIDRVEGNLTRQIDGLDKRLDDIEVNVIPSLRRAITAR